MTDTVNVAAVTLYGPGNRAVVLHPGGDAHPNAEATRDRLTRHGYDVVPLPPDPAAFLAGAPSKVHTRALRILRALEGRAA